MRKVTLIAVFVGACGLTAAGTHYATAEYVSTQVTSYVSVSNNTSDQVKKYTDQEEADLRLGQYAINAMYKAGAKDKISDAKKQVLARAIVRVSNDIFLKEEDKKAFISIIAIESAFQRFVQSPTGPKGYAQVAKKSFFEAMADCGVTSLHDEDVWETDLNLYAGACYFRKQIDANNGDQYMAMIAYNQGPSSDSLKSYAKNGSMDNLEVLKYMAKFTFLKRTLTDTKQPNIPSIDELPKPTSPTSTKK
jgi:Transglycosylase SLT domain